MRRPAAANPLRQLIEGASTTDSGLRRVERRDDPIEHTEDTSDPQDVLEGRTTASLDTLQRARADARPISGLVDRQMLQPPPLGQVCTTTLQRSTDRDWSPGSSGSHTRKVSSMSC